MKKFERGLANLDKLKKWYSNNKGERNEATTRLHLIDKIIIDSLNWKKDDVTTEENHNNEYTDYTLSLSRPSVIVEAKREGVFFELPAGYTKMIKCDIKTLCKDNKKIKEAVKQVIKYCSSRGVEIGVVTNGWQLVLFVASRVDGVPPIDGKAYVFPNIESMYDNFTDLWNFLSPDGIINNSLLNSLSENLIPELPIKLSGKLNNYPGIKDRNVNQLDIQNLSEVILEDVIRDEMLEKSFLEQCYCKNGAISQYSLISKKVLQSRYDYLVEQNTQGVIVQSATNKKGIHPDFEDILNNCMDKRPILLVGDVGAGKTTFINNLIKIEASNIFKKAIAIKIDLGSKAVLSDNIKNSIYNEIIAQLKEEYGIDINVNNFIRGVYHRELLRFKKGIHEPYYQTNNKEKIVELEIKFLEDKTKDKFSFLKDCLTHIHIGRRQQVIIFIDNCDQRDYNAQQEAFLISQEFAEHWPVTVFTSLRPETYHQSLKKGALSAYNPRSFTISPPKVEEVLEKRLTFAQKITRGEIKATTLTGKIETSKLNSLLEVLKHSLNVNKGLLELIENISSGNIRKAIDLVKRFLGSGHVDTTKILKINEKALEEGESPYRIPVHEFLRAIIFGDNVYYSSERSDVVNLFDISSKDLKEHFLPSICLAILNLEVSKGSSNGFLEPKKLYGHLQNLGYTTNQINSCLDKLYANKLIDTSLRGAPINFDFDKEPKMIRIKSLGAYHLCELLNLFVYFDAIVVDTPIIIDDYVDKIKDVDSIEKRLQRASIFVNYLNKAWEEVDKGKTNFNWNEISDSLKKAIADIQKKVDDKKRDCG